MRLNNEEKTLCNRGRKNEAIEALCARGVPIIKAERMVERYVFSAEGQRGKFCAQQDGLYIGQRSP